MSDPTITALKPHPTDPGRVSVRVGRKKVATLSADDVRELQLRVGAAWTDDLAARVAARVAARAAREQAFRDALRRVRRRAVGVEELRRKLRQKGHEDECVGAAIDRLTVAGYLDDRAYAESLVRRELARKPAGPRLLRMRLQQKFLPRELIDEVLAELEADDGTDHRAAALELARKKLDTATMQRADPATRYRRLTSLLARRGFDGDTIQHALRQLPLSAGGPDSAF